MCFISLLLPFSFLHFLNPLFTSLLFSLHSSSHFPFFSFVFIYPLFTPFLFLHILHFLSTCLLLLFSFPYQFPTISFISLHSSFPLLTTVLFLNLFFYIPFPVPHSFLRWKKMKNTKQPSSLVFFLHLCCILQPFSVSVS